MGKIKGVIQFTGKLGQVVGYKGRNSRRYIRERVTQIGNPRSTGQNIQRMILSTAAVGVSKLKAILSNSFEGKQYGADSLAFARQLWMRQLRTSDIMSNSLNYIKKGEQRFAINPYQVSRGSLNAPAIGFVTNSENEFYVRGSVNEHDNQGTASECFPNVPVGRQFTIIAVAEKGAPQVAYCRFAFKDDVTPAFVQGGRGYVLNPAAIDLAKADGHWEVLKFTDESVSGSNVLAIDASDMLFAEGNDDFDMTAAAALIISDKEGGLRSTTSLVINPLYTARQYSASEAAPTFGNVATEVNVASDVYLNNSSSESGTAAYASITPGLPSQIAEGTTKLFSVTLPTSAALQTIAGVFTDGTEDVDFDVPGAGGVTSSGVEVAVQQVGNVHVLSIRMVESMAVTIKSLTITAGGEEYTF